MLTMCIFCIRVSAVCFKIPLEIQQVDSKGVTKVLPLGTTEGNIMT